MKTIKVLEKENTGAEYIENLGWLDQPVKDDIVIIDNLKTKKLVKTKELKRDDKVLATEGDFSLIETINTNEYVVKPLDTLEKISKKFNIDYSRLVQINNLSTTKLFIGQVLKL